MRFHKYKKAQKEYKTPKSTKKYKNKTNLKFINLQFIDTRFISLRFIDIVDHLKKHHQQVEKCNLFAYLRKKVSTMEMLIPLNQQKY